MGFNYHEGTIDDSSKPLISRALRLRDMEDLSEGYCRDSAVWFDTVTRPIIDSVELCYQEHQLSDDIVPEDWYRVLRVPLGFIIDGSHRDDLFDDAGKILMPLPVETVAPYEGAVPESAIDFIYNDMQLSEASRVLNETYGFILSRNVLLVVNDADDNPLA